MARTDIQYKIDALLRTAKATSDPYLRERCCMEAKTLLDEMGPFAIVSEKDDPVRTFVTSFYELTMNPSDKILKSDFDARFYEWNKNGDEVIDKKTLKRRMISLGLAVNPRGNYGDKRGVYVYIGIKKRNDLTREAVKHAET